MATTVIIEPDTAGHHLQSVANLYPVARESGPVLLLTARGARQDPEFAAFLGEIADLEVREVFDGKRPPTRDIVTVLRDVCREREVGTAVHMDADQALKRWWFLVPRVFGLRRRPRMVFMLTRYPARLRLDDVVGWRLRLPKAVLAAVALLTGSLHRVVGYAGRDDTARGWIVKRVRDPDLCLAHARDRAAIRAELGLPADRVIVGIFGLISERRNAPLVWEAMRHVDLDGDLLLAGAQDPDVQEWVASVESTPRRRIICFEGFLPNELIDRLVAASDVAPLPLTNNGPSGIMGKAIAAGVPIVTAGSVVRARELQAADAGEVAEMTPESIGAAIVRVLERSDGQPWSSRIPPVTAESYSRILLGRPEAG